MDPYTLDPDDTLKGTLKGTLMVPFFLEPLSKEGPENPEAPGHGQREPLQTNLLPRSILRRKG